MADDDKKSPRLITLTEEQFIRLLEAAKGSGPQQATSVQFEPDKQLRDQMIAIRGPAMPAPERIRRTSARTGMTFDAVIQRGLVMDLQRELAPPGAFVHVDEGGLVPKGMLIRGKDGQPTPQHRQWYWRTIRKPNFEDFVGHDVAWLMRMTNAPVDEQVAAE